MQDRSRQHHFHKGEREDECVGPETARGEKPHADRAQTLAPARLLIANGNRVGSARHHDGVADVKEADRKKAHGRDDAHRERHRESADVVAREVEHRKRHEVGFAPSLGFAARKQDSKRNERPVGKESDKERNQKVARELHAREKYDHRTGQRHVEDEHAHRPHGIAGEGAVKPQDLADHDDGDVGKDIGESVHLS